MEVWVTNKVTDEVISWSKYFNVTRPDLPILDPCFFTPMHIPTFFIHKTNSIVLWCDKVVGEGYACTSFYEIGQSEINKQVETGQPFRGEGERNPCVCSFVYVPSLVPLPE
ncbi:putative F-box protein [Cardamine amara subsp. amara]|uniref:F-box protein n=1 Tax=Cardamine amara subsp. amara TaxID=228776 RepID=A0ABD1B292_CARAN